MAIFKDDNYLIKNNITHIKRIKKSENNLNNI